MTIEERIDWENVSYRMNEEGFHYCFNDYSSFKEIKDEEFHKLRKEYLLAASKLERYVNTKLMEEVDGDYE